MKKILWFFLALALCGNAYACNPIGWVLVKTGSLGVGETVCTYAKNGYQTTIVVSGFCPFHPC